MDKKQLRNLQSEQILNMAAIYRACDLKPAEVATRLSRVNSKVPKEWTEKIERQIMNQMAEVVSLVEIPLEKLIPRLISELDTHFEQKKVLLNMEATEVEPIAYITTSTKRVLAIYLPGDQYRPRSSKYDDSIPTYLTLSDLFAKGEKSFQLTDRGLQHARAKTKKEFPVDKD